MSPVRVQRQRRKGFKMPEGAVYVGRGTRFGNPWKVERFAPVPGDTKEYAAVLRGYRGVDYVHPFDHYREAAQRAVAGYHVHLTRGEGPTAEEIATLKGKDLACWCAPGMPCHADILLKLANAEKHDEGGPLTGELSEVVNKTATPEAVLTPQQWAEVAK